MTATERPRLASKVVAALLAATEDATLLLEVVHAHRCESGGRVVLGLVVMNLVDWNCGVHDVWFDGLWKVVS